MNKLFIFIFILFMNNIYAQNNSEKVTNKYFNDIKSDSRELYMFLLQMPKGADLHTHFSGATYAENLLSYSYNDYLCINDKTSTVLASCDNDQKLYNMISNNELYARLIKDWSMLDFISFKENKNEHFFNAFKKFQILINRYQNKILTEILDRASKQNISYIELMITSGNIGINIKSEIKDIIQKTKWNDNLDVLYKKLLASGVDQIATSLSNKITLLDNSYKKLNCNQHSNCNIKLRYLYSVKRSYTPIEVYTQLIIAFELAKQDKRVLGINMVDPEDAPIALKDYKTHMRMINTLHKIYPEVNISLHAGELAIGSVAPQELSFHIYDAVNIAMAKRIGHGTDIAYENDAHELLMEMARKQIFVEINLTSNETLLNTNKDNHPFPIYLKYKVPVGLSTDDEGILRTTLTQEFMRAVIEYNLSYEQLKMLARNTISYSFLPGKNLWQKPNSTHMTHNCSKSMLETNKLSNLCKKFLDSSEKASLQWDLEKRFKDFELKFIHK